MQNWVTAIRAASGPLYLAIADTIEGAIRAGRIRPGQRLPPQRDLARALDVDLTTVTRAYGLLRSSGLVEGAGRLGSFVRNGAHVQALAAQASDDTGMNMPPQPGFSQLSEAIRTGMAALLRASGPSPLLQYQPTGGYGHDRAVAAEALSARGMPSTEDEVAIAAGGQNALHAILGNVLAPGDRLAAGRFVYPGLLALAARFGIRVDPVETDAEGLDPDGVARAFRGGAKAVYIVPTNDNPTTATLGAERRAAIAALARRHGAQIIEDDAYGRLPAVPPATIASLAPERTWHIASLSKIVSPALRIAHVRAPSARDAWRLSADIHETAVMAAPLNAALVTGWIRDGTLDRLVAGVRSEAVARQRIAAHHLGQVPHAAHSEGYHLWLPLGPGMAATDLAAAVRGMGLSIVSGEAFAVRKDHPAAAVRISLGGAIDHDRLRRALECLEALLLRNRARAAG